MNPFGGGEERGWRSGVSTEVPGKDGGAPIASLCSLNDMRRSEKAKVARKGITGYPGAEKP
jgi:hypothetical protein